MPTKPGIIYRMEWNTVENVPMRVDISDASIQIDSVTGEEQIKILDASGDPLHVSITDNDENKFTPIRAKKATIKFLNSTEINYLTFASGEDDRFPVTASCNGIPIFVGWLQQGDIREPFLFQEAQEVVLTAIDGLAFLKNVPLTDFTGANPTGMHPIMDYIAYALNKTGLNANINVFNNIREQNSPGVWKTIATFTAPNTFTVPLPGYTNINQLNFFKVGHTIVTTGSASNNWTKNILSVTDSGSGTAIITVASGITNEVSGPLINFVDATDGGCWYSTCYLDAKTFESDIGVCEDCDTVLRKILGHDSFIVQRLGNWYIFRVKEMRHDFQQYQSAYSNVGSFNGFTPGFNWQKAIGLKDVLGTPFPIAPDSNAFFSKEATTRTLSRPNGNVKLTYNFNNPSEVPCNIDFSRGTTFIADLPDETIDGIVYKAKSYSVDCWTLYQKLPNNSPFAGTVNGYIKKLFLNGYEKERWLVLEPYPGGGVGDINHINYFKSEPIPLNIKDKVNISISWKWDYNNGATGMQTDVVFLALLIGSDGSYWWLTQEGVWLLFAAPSYAFVGQTVDVTGVDETQVRSLSADSNPAPIDGNLYILLPSHGWFDNYGGYGNVLYNGLSVEYIPFIGGSYQHFTGQYFKSTRTGNYKSKIEEEVFVSNCPMKIPKGSIQIITPAGAYRLPDRFYDGQEFLYPDDGNNNLYAFGDLQVRAYHNQFRNPDPVYEITAQGTGITAVTAFELIERIIDRDSEPATNNAVNQLVWIDMDWKRLEWKGAMIKNFDVITGFVFDTVEFKYITE